MKKNVAISAVITVVLLIVAIVMVSCGFAQGKAFNGGSAVRVNIGSSYDEEKLNAIVSSSALGNGKVMKIGLTAIEIETGAMSEDALAANAEALVKSIQAEYANASLVYADRFNAISDTTMKTVITAWVAFIVLAYVYGLIRFNWRLSLAPLAVSLIAAIATAAITLALSGVFAITNTFIASVSATALVAYLYAIAYCAKCKEIPDYTLKTCDLAVPVTVIVACVLVAVIGGMSVVNTLFCAVIGSVCACIAAYCLVPAYWQVLSKKAAK